MVIKRIDTPKADSDEKESVLKNLREYKKIIAQQPHKPKKYHRELER